MPGGVSRRPVPATVVASVQVLAVALGAAIWSARLIRPSGEWLWNLDLPKIDFPLAVFFREAVREGRLPLWSDRLGLGFPLYAEGQIGAFYPPNWLLFQLDAITALDVARVLHLALAGLGAGLLVLRIRGTLPGAMIAALVAVLGCAITAKLEWHNLVAAYAWIPWVLLPLVRRPRPTSSGLVVAGVLFGVQALAGHPNTWLLTGVALTAVLVAGRDGPLAGLRRAVGVGLLGGAIGAVQLLPTAVLAALSVRSAALSPDDLFAAAATPFDILLPSFSSAFTRVTEGAWDIYAVWYPDGVFAHLEAAAFVGLPVLALAAGGATLRRSRPFLLAIVLLVAIPVVEAFRPDVLLSIPFLNGIRAPVRAYLVAALLLGVVAGLAVGRPTRLGMRPRLSTLVVAILVAAYGLVAGLALLAPDIFNRLVLAFSTFGTLEDIAGRRDLAIAALTAPLPLLVELAAGLAILVVIWIGARSGPGDRFAPARTAVAPLAVLIVALPLAVAGPLPNETKTADAISSAGSPFVAAAAAAAPHRMITIDAPGYYVGMPDQPAANGFADLRMFSSLNLRATDLVTDAAGQNSLEGQRLRRVLGVDIAVTFSGPCPGTPVATSDPDQATFCRDGEALRPPYWIPLDAAAADPAPGGPIRPREATLSLDAVLAEAIPATVLSRGPGHVAASVTAATDGWLWVDEAWWPGWRTTVDGEAVVPLRALAGMLVPLPAGTHTVELALVPWDALAGLAIGAAALAVALGWVALDRRRSKRRADGPADRTPVNEVPGR